MPSAVFANCDLSTTNIQKLSQYYLDTNYTYNTHRLKKPKIVVSNTKVHKYYAKEFNGTITIFAKELNDCYCDQYFDGLKPFLQEVVSHEYMHYLDEKLHLSKRINEKRMSENTAEIGEHVFKTLIWHNSYTTHDLTPQSTKKYQRLLGILQTK